MEKASPQADECFCLKKTTRIFEERYAVSDLWKSPKIGVSIPQNLEKCFSDSIPEKILVVFEKATFWRVLPKKLTRRDNPDPK